MVAFGAHGASGPAAAEKFVGRVEAWNPFVLQPLDMTPIYESIRKTGRLLVVQESGETQGLGDRIIALAARECFAALRCPPKLVASPDTPIPFAPELEVCCRPNVERIVAAIGSLLDASSVSQGSR